MARSNLQIKVGKYSGTGVAQNITGIGFRPDLVIIKGTADNAVFRTKERRGDSTGFLASSNTNLTLRITSFLNDGFAIGNTAQVNSNGVVYYYIAMKGAAAQQYFATGNYMGTGADNRNLTGAGTTFTPDIVFMQAISGAVPAVWKSSAMAGDTSAEFGSGVGAANYIQSLIANGFQLGTATRVNASAVEYFYVSMKALTGTIAVGTFTGAGVEQKISGLGFQPDVVIVKNYTTTDQARILTSTMVTDAVTSLYMGTTATDAQGIKTIDSTGFTLGTNASVTGNTNTIYWIAFKAGNFNVPLTRTAS